jgi:uncharacterized phage protein gp47/JayE
MPVPDLRPYVDLTIDDRTPQDLFDAFLADAASRIPDWDPLETEPAVIYAQAHCQVFSELIAAINRLPGATFEALLTRGYDLGRSQGVAAAGQVTFTVSDRLGHTLPGGTRLAIAQDDGTLATLTTNVDVVVAPGAGDAVADVTADDVGTLLNATPVGTPVQVLDSIAFLDEVTVTTELSGGVDPEESEAYLTRGSVLLQRQVITLVTPRQFALAALGVAGVGRAFAIDRYDPGIAGVPPNANGNMSVGLTDAAGLAVSAAVSTAVSDALTPDMQGGLILHLLDPTTTVVNVSVTVHRDATLSDTDAAAAVADAVTAWLSPATWPFAGTVYVTELEYVIRSVPGIDRVVAVATPAADVVLAGVVPLAQAGTVAVTVTSG